MTYLDPKVWGPHYWFFLHTISITYPHHPNAVTKKKYYDLIQNLHVFLPVEKIATEFSKLLEQYPVTPYLDNRESFVRWTWFVHNKINEKLEKPKISMEDFYKRYYENYKPSDVKYREFYKIREKVIYLVIVLLIVGVTYIFYNK
jgi:FAD-linked sulfhydryl oxidase